MYIRRMKRISDRDVTQHHGELRS